MNPSINVFLLPDLIPENALDGGTAVVIDILRATTTMTCGLANGAQRIIPCVGVEEAHATRDRLKTDSVPVLLGGEREGKPLPGFDLGNSPESYSQQTVGDKTVVMTTTNGTRAMSMCKGSAEIVIGSFANLSRVIQHLKQRDKINLVCSGTHRHVTSEDVLFAGAIASQLIGDRRKATGMAAGLNDQARLAIAHWLWLCQESNGQANDDAAMDHTTEQATQPPSLEHLEIAFQQSLGGSNLVKQNRGRDLAYAAVIDRHCNLPILNIDSWEITNA